MSEKKELGLQKWDPRNIKVNRVIVALAKKGSGKSTFVHDVASYISSKMDIGIAMTPTIGSLRTFRKFLPECLVYNEFRGNILEQLMTTQKQRLEANMRTRKVCIFLDDLGFDKSIFRTHMTLFRELFMNGRHLNISVVMCLQYVTDLPPDLRHNTDYLACFKDTCKDNRIKLHKYFFGVFPSIHDFENVFSSCTDNFECLILDSTCNNNNINECVFWYRSPIDTDIPEFIFGRPIYWDLWHRFKKPAKLPDAMGAIACYSNKEKRIQEIHKLDEKGNPLSKNTKPRSPVQERVPSLYVQLE